MSPTLASELTKATGNDLQTFFQSYFWLIVVVAVGVLGFFGWLYYSDWRRTRSYRRYVEGKRRKPV